MDLLPQMGSEDLDQGDLESRNLAVQEDTSEIQLHLETDVDIGSVDGRRPPKRETTIRNLVETCAFQESVFVRAYDDEFMLEKW